LQRLLQNSNLDANRSKNTFKSAFKGISKDSRGVDVASGANQVVMVEVGCDEVGGGMKGAGVLMSKSEAWRQLGTSLALLT